MPCHVCSTNEQLWWGCLSVCQGGWGNWKFSHHAFSLFMSCMSNYLQYSTPSYSFLAQWMCFVLYSWVLFKNNLLASSQSSLVIISGLHVANHLPFLNADVPLQGAESFSLQCQWLWLHGVVSIHYTLPGTHHSFFFCLFIFAFEYSTLKFVNFSNYSF